MPPELREWTDFFVAEVGAAAALAGLLMVSISINLARILSFPQLPGRAGETLMLLVGAMLVASLGLVPGQPLAALGAEYLVIGAVLAAAAMQLALRTRHALKPEERAMRLYFRLLCTQSASLPVAVGGIAVLAGQPAGLYGAMAGIVISLVVGVLNAWVLLVEIMR